MTLSALIVELQKNKYSSMTDAEALAALPPQELKVGRIEGDNKLDLLTIVVEGLLQRFWLAESERTDEDLIANHVAITDGTGCETYRHLAMTLVESLSPALLMMPQYRINLGLEKIKALVDGAKLFGLLKDEQYNTIIELATYKTGIDFTAYQEQDIKQAREHIALIGETPATEIFYNQYNSNDVGHFLNISSFRKIKFAAMFDTKPSIDCIVSVVLESEPVSGNEWIVEETIVINVKANQAPQWLPIANRFKNRKLRVQKATVNLINTPFKLDVQGVE